MSNIPGAFGRREKCPCCNNPWDQSTDAGSLFVCNPCFQEDKSSRGLDPANFDTSVSPKDNFYLYSNGRWKQNNPIPAEYSSWNTFLALRDLNLERIKAILDELLASDSTSAPLAGEARKVADFYKAAIDADGVEAVGLAPLDGALAATAPAAVANDVTACVAALHAQFGVKAFFGLYSSPDKMDAGHTLCTVAQVWRPVFLYFPW